VTTVEPEPDAIEEKGVTGKRKAGSEEVLGDQKWGKSCGKKTHPQSDERGAKEKRVHESNVLHGFQKSKTQEQDSSGKKTVVTKRSCAGRIRKPKKKKSTTT